MVSCHKSALHVKLLICGQACFNPKIQPATKNFFFYNSFNYILFPTYKKNILNKLATIPRVSLIFKKHTKTQILKLVALTQIRNKIGNQVSRPLMLIKHTKIAAMDK